MLDAIWRFGHWNAMLFEIWNEIWNAMLDAIWKFENYITETVKTHQMSEELFKSMIKGKSQHCRQVPPLRKTNSGGCRINFLKRPGPDSRVAPTSSPRQGSSGKSSSEITSFLQHASTIDCTKSGEDTFCS